MDHAPREGPGDQKDVLPKKDNVTQSDRGLQIWDDEAMGEGVGTGGSGTAERAARIAEGQKKQARETDAGGA